MPFTVNRGLAVSALLLIGVAFLGHAAYIPTKAWVAQRLLERAWVSTQIGRAPPPWPWADTRPVARLRQPDLGIDQVVLEGASGRVLAFGPGWLPGTVVPGEVGNVVISGHRDTHFRWLADLRPGDSLELVLADGRRRAYTVAGTAVHHASNVGLLDPEAADRLLLLTCFPFDAVDVGTPWRFVVTAGPVRPSTT